MRNAAIVAAIRAALPKKVTCPSCHHKQTVARKHAEVKCAKCGATIKVPS
jgi:ribosomal protein S27E